MRAKATSIVKCFITLLMYLLAVEALVVVVVTVVVVAIVVVLIFTNQRYKIFFYISKFLLRFNQLFVNTVQLCYNYMFYQTLLSF